MRLAFLQTQDGSGALAPEEHIDKDGYVDSVSLSYAHVTDEGKVVRYGEQIGVIRDLITDANQKPKLK